MPGPLSLDLRERVVAAYERGEGSFAVLGERFGVGEATVNRWVSRKRKQGDVSPSPMGGARHERKIDEAGEAFVAQTLEALPDSTVAELTAAYAEAFGVAMNPETMRRALHRMGYRRKRRRLQASSARS